MAAYPFGVWQWKDLREQLKTKYGVTPKSIKIGDQDSIYLVRKNGEKPITHMLPVLLEDDENVTPQVLRNICDGLKVSKQDFGLTLG